MPGKPPGRGKGGNAVTKVDRDTSKKNVALSKAQQRDEMAIKAFKARQKQLKKELSSLRKLQKTIDDMIKEADENTTLDARFLRMVVGKAKSLQDVQKYIQISEQTYCDAAAKPQEYTAIVRDAGKVQKVNSVKTLGDMSIMLAVSIVLLNRLLSLKAK